MAIEATETIVYIKKFLVFSIRTSYKSARDHPFVFGMLCSLLILYSSFPGLFAFLVSSSPVIICTTLLLGTLLSYGEPNIPEVEEEDKKTDEISALKVEAPANDQIVQTDESFTVQSHVDNRREVAELAVREAVVSEKPAVTSAKAEEETPLLDTHNEGDEKDYIVLAPSPSAYEDKKDVHDEKVAEEREIHDQETAKTREFSGEKFAEVLSQVGEDGGGSSTLDQKDIEGLKVDTEKPVLDNYFDSSLGSPWLHIDLHDARSDSESDRAESSSPDASMADILPMLDELHPLLDSEHPQPARISKDDSDSDSSQDHESDVGSMEEDAKNEEIGEDEEAQEEKDDGTQAAVTWTADDQKNLMDLGSSETERNRRLESLIAKRRARKDLRSVTQRNLIDFDSHYSASSMAELSRFHVQVPNISAPRQNPFDLPYDSEEKAGSPVIPASAPSVLQPRQNPFDLPSDQAHESGSLTGEYWSHEEFVSVLHHEMSSRRHESFILRGGEPKREEHGSRMKPYFVPEGMDSGETSSAVFQRQFSDKSDAKVSSVAESDTVASDTDGTGHAELVEQEFNQGIEEVESMYVKQDKNEINMTDDHEVDTDAGNVTKQAHQTVEAEEQETRVTVDSTPSTPVAEKLEVVEEKYDESSASSSPEENKKSLDFSLQEQSSHLDPTRNPTPSVLADPDLLSWEERFNGSQPSYSIYDSSLQKRSFKNSTLDEALFNAGEGRCLDASTSMNSGMEADTSVVGSSPGPVDLASASEGLQAASLSLASAGESESRGHDVTEFGALTFHEDSGLLIAPVSPGPSAAEIMHHSSLSSSESESSKVSPCDMDASPQTEGDEEIEAAVSQHSPVSSDDLISSAVEMAELSTENSLTRPSSISTLEESQVGILPEENLEDSKPKEDYESFSKPGLVVGLTGLQAIEEPTIVDYDIEKELALFERKPAMETGKGCDDNRFADGPEDDNSLVVTPTTSVHAHGITGLRLLEPTNSKDFSSMSDVKSELEINSKGDFTELRGDIINAVQSKQGDCSPKNLMHSDEEWIDENHMLELDAVGDFHVQELKSDLQGSEQNFHTDALSDDIGTEALICEKHGMPSQLEISEISSIDDADLLLKLTSQTNLTNSEELNSDVNQPRAVVSDAGSSFGQHDVDLEQTVYNYRVALHVLRTSSTEEIDSIFERHHEEAVISSFSEPTVDNSMPPKPEGGPTEMKFAEGNPQLTEPDSEMIVLEAKSVDDINSAFKQLNVEGVTKSDSEMLVHEAKFIEDIDSASKQLKEGLNKSNSEMPLLVANSVNDIDSVFKQLSSECLNKSESEMLTHEAKSIEDIGSASKQLNVEGLNKSDSDMLVLEAKSVDDINLAFKLLSAEGLNKSNSEMLVHEAKSVQDIASASEQLREEDPNISDTEVIVLEAKSVEDINAAFKLLSEESLNISTNPEVGQFQVLPSDRHLGSMGFHSDLQVLDAKSLEDIHVALYGASENSPEVIRPKDGFKSEAEASERHLDPEVLEVHSAEEIELASKESCEAKC